MMRWQTRNPGCCVRQQKGPRGALTLGADITLIPLVTGRFRAGAGAGIIIRRLYNRGFATALHDKRELPLQVLCLQRPKWRWPVLCAKTGHTQYWQHSIAYLIDIGRIWRQRGIERGMTYPAVYPR